MTFHESFMKIHSPVSHDITYKHESKTYKNQSWIQRVNCNTPKMFQIVPCLMSNLLRMSWKSVYPFSHNDADTNFHENIEKETLYPKG